MIRFKFLVGSLLVGVGWLEVWLWVHWRGLGKLKALLVRRSSRFALFLFLSFMFMAWSGDRKASSRIYSEAYSFTSFSTRFKNVHVKDIEVFEVQYCFLFVCSYRLASNYSAS
jgi:hypothetical protein